MAGLNALTWPRELVVRAYHAHISSGLSGDPEWVPDDWTRSEFIESGRARAAREILEQWLYSEQAVLGHLTWMIRREPERHAGGEAVANWLDDLLWGRGKAALRDPQDRIAAQLAADNMARADFCRMDFGAVVGMVLERGEEARPLS